MNASEWKRASDDERIKYCQNVADDYPEGHREHREIERQIETIKQKGKK